MEVFKILGRIALEGADEAGSELDNLKGKASKLGSGLKVVGKAFAGLTTAVGGIAVAVGAASVKVGAAFDSQMSTVQSISGATAEEFEMLRAKAQEMGATTSFSATESAQAFEYMAMAGWDAQQMSDGLAGVMNLAAASGEDLASASDIVTDAMTAFGMQAEESTYFSDVLAQTASSANTNVSMMGETFKYVAPLAGAMGYSIEDMSVAIGLMANSGIKGSQSGTSLRNIITNLASPSKEVAQAMKDLGISLTDNDGNVKTFGETLGDLRESFADLDEVERTLYASSIAGKEGMSGFLALVNSSDEDFEKLTKQIENCDGAAQKMADVRMDNLSGDVTLFKSALEGAGIAISDQLSPVLRDFVQNATAMIPKAQDSIAKFGGKIAEIGSKLLPVLIDTAEKLMPVISEVLDVISDMLDDLLPSFMDMLDIIVPILTEIVTDIAPFISQLLKSAMDFLKPICTNLLPPLAQLLEAVLNILTPVLKVLSPIVDFLVEITSSVFGSLIDGLSKLLGFDAVEKTAEQFSKLSVEEQKTIDKTNELIEATKNMNSEREIIINGKNAEFGYYQDLADELSTIVDENGKIKRGYEDRAKVITTTLNDALGTEIKMNDGVIESYKDVQKEIQNTIEIKKAQAILDSMESEYIEATQRVKDLAIERADAEEQILETKSEIYNAEKELNEYANELLKKGTNIVEKDVEKLDELKAKVDGLNSRLSDNEKNLKNINKTMEENSAVIVNFAKVQEDIATESIENLSLDLVALQENFVTAENANADTLIRQTKNFKETCDKLREQAKVKGSGITEEMVQNYEEMYYRSAQELSELTGMSMTEIGDLIRFLESKNSDFSAAGTNNGNSYVTSLRDTISSAGDSVIYAAQNIADNISSMFSNASIDISGSVSTNKSKLAGHAKGGIVTREHIARVGEDGAEAIIPLEKNTEWIDKVASRINGGTSNNAVLEKLTELNENIKNLKVYLDSGTLVGEIAPKMDKKLGSIAKRKRRGAVV